MANIGYIALFLALITSLFSAVAYIIGKKRRNQALIKYAKNSLLATCGLVSAAVVTLLVAILTHNFQIDYVASYTSRDMSLPYLFSALWAGNNGSLLFWAWLLSIFAVIALLRKQTNNSDLIPYAAAVMMIIQAFFILLLLSVSNPFQELSFIPADGRGLNPMLENAGMIIHPPLLLAGYIGFTIPFAFAISALLTKRLGNEWIQAARRWTLISWLLLGIGNLIGAWWAYVELGWGGYWAWDPVENAGLMPWLVATAFLHTIIIQRRKDMLKRWSMALIILTFNLAIFGTFLTRSGILSSVHTFGETGLEPFFITFLLISVFGSFGLLIFRNDKMKSEGEVGSLVSREFTFYINNFLFVGSALIILIGTIFPALSEAVRGVQIEVGQSFFNTVNVPIFLAIILLIGICTVFGWRRLSNKQIINQFIWPLSVTVILVVILIITGVREWSALIASFLCSLVFFVVLYKWFYEIRERVLATGDKYTKAFWRLLSRNTPHYGAYIVHLSIVVIAVGIIGSSVYDIEKGATLRPGESTAINDYTITYNNIYADESASKTAVATNLSIYDNGKLVGELVPEKIFHQNYEQPVSEVAIRSTILEDLYIILAGWEQDGTASFNILINPLIIWIWIGGGIFLLGGFMVFWPTRGEMPAPRPVAKDVEKTPESEDEIENQIRELRRSKGRFCTECGAKHQPDDIYCAHCGAILNEGKDDD